MKEPLASVRIDLWLWAARFYKTRSLAKQAVVGGKVEIGGQAMKPSRAVKPGELLSVRRGDEVFAIEVLVLSDVRGLTPGRPGKPIDLDQRKLALAISATVRA